MTAAEIPSDAVELRTAKQAAELVGVRRQDLIDWLASHEIVAFAAAPGTVGYLFRLVDLEAGAMQPGAEAHIVEVRTAKQAAAFLEISRPNLDKWLRYREVLPFAFGPKPLGRLYHLGQLKQAKKAWLRERDRGGDEKRRQAAMANQEEQDG